MKKLLLVFLLAFTALAIQAQYRTYKSQYDVKNYKYQKTDRYNPTIAGFMSIVPGLGHCYVGEPLRGFGFFGLTYGSLVLTVYGISQAYTPKDKEKVGWLVGGGTVMFIGSYIWSIADVTRLAKIKNMRIRDQKLALHLYPSFQSTPDENFSSANAPGLTMTVNF
ncbi:MAG: hypothetical protein ACM3O8_07840 [Methylococcaceae bacterium]|nr:hypothetical protein [Prolixibacteraceae bacterium]